MKMRIRWFKLICIGYVVLLVLNACGGEKETSPELRSPQNTRESGPQPQTLEPSQPEIFVGLADPTIGEMRLPVIDGIAGRLLFVQQNQLYIGAFDGEELDIVEGVGGPSDNIQLSPNGRKVIFVTGESGVSQVKITDLDTLETTNLFTTEGGVLRSLSWSPDNEWVAFIQTKPFVPE